MSEIGLLTNLVSLSMGRYFVEIEACVLQLMGLLLYIVLGLGMVDRLYDHRITILTWLSCTLIPYSPSKPKKEHVSLIATIPTELGRLTTLQVLALGKRRSTFGCPLPDEKVHHDSNSL
jgi:hypothetical protein